MLSRSHSFEFIALQINFPCNFPIIVVGLQRPPVGAKPTLEATEMLPVG